jgi:phosphopantothenoylcysteine decarboxylase/phosphopantothenate--cysteine ligase
MNVRMWDNAATQANLETLRARGISMMGPDSGDMACGEFGAGRMSEPAEMAELIAARLSEPQDLAGKHAVVTAGPTVEPIDPVRYVSNRSSGKQGYAIARALAERGARVTLISGPTELDGPAGVETVRLNTAREMMAAVEGALPADIFVGVAAVADWGIDSPATRKLKKGKDGAPKIEWVENPDILKTVAAHKKRPGLVIGFAAETDDVVAHAKAKRERKGCDWILANDVSCSAETASVFGADGNEITFLTGSVQESWPRASKWEQSRRLAEAIAQHFVSE